jgi:hypothetical protein
MSYREVTDKLTDDMLALILLLKVEEGQVEYPNDLDGNPIYKVKAYNNWYIVDGERIYEKE